MVNIFIIIVNQFTVSVNELREMFNKTYTNSTISRRVWIPGKIPKKHRQSHGDAPYLDKS